jgi:hypothetical protein
MQRFFNPFPNVSCVAVVVREKADRTKAATLIRRVRYVIVDGHHRFNALKELHKEGFPNLPKLVWCYPSRKSLFVHRLEGCFCSGCTQVNCQVLDQLTVMEQFVFSERSNHTNHDGTVVLTLYDRLTQVRHLRILRYV